MFRKHLDGDGRRLARPSVRRVSAARCLVLAETDRNPGDEAALAQAEVSGIGQRREAKTCRVVTPLTRRQIAPSRCCFGLVPTSHLS